MGQKVPSIVTDLYGMRNKLNQQVPVELEQDPETSKQAYMPEKENNRLDDAVNVHLKRRYGDFQRSRSDLLDRLHTMESRLATEEKDLSSRLETVQTTIQEIRQLLSAIPADDPGKEAFSDRGELADVTLKIEKQRIEMMRMLPIVDGASEKQRSLDGSPAGKSKAETGIILDSLGFRQVLRLAWAINLPVLIAILISALIVAIAVIGSFKGLF